MNEDVAIGYCKVDHRIMCLSVKHHWNESSASTLRLFKTGETVQVRVSGMWVRCYWMLCLLLTRVVIGSIVPRIFTA